MENFKSKFVTAEAAVAAAVKDGDWVDYGSVSYTHLTLPTIA